MKKLCSILVLLTVLTAGLFADGTKVTNEKTPSKWSDMTYTNVPIMKILDAKDGYLVIYQKNKLGVGTTVIPKNWVKGNVESPRKLQMRNTKQDNSSFMTIVKKGGNFHRVILTVPQSKSNSVWGVYSTSALLEGTDKETLEELDL